MPEKNLEYKLIIDADTGEAKVVRAEIEKIGRAGERAADRTTRGFNRAKGQLSDFERTMGRARRTVIAFAAVMIGRELVQAFSRLPRIGIEFNAQLEQSRLGIASILAAQGEFVDQQGQELVGRQKLNAALGMSRDIVRRLRIDNLETIATLDQLVIAFQQTLAPGLEAGFDVDRVREFTKAMVQAAGAIGLNLNMLAEETRSLLRGTITARTTRIATALGITNEDIRSMRGNADALFAFLMNRLSAFVEAGEESQRTWMGVISNLADAVKEVLGVAFLDLFENLKGHFTDLQGYLVQFNKQTGKIQLNPEVVATMKDFAGSLELAADSVALVVKGLGEINRLHRAQAAAGPGARTARGALGPLGIFYGIGDVVDMLKEDIGELSPTIRETFRLLFEPGRPMGLVEAFKAGSQAASDHQQALERSLVGLAQFREGYSAAAVGVERIAYSTAKRQTETAQKRLEELQEILNKEVAIRDKALATIQSRAESAARAEERIISRIADLRSSLQMVELSGEEANREIKRRSMTEEELNADKRREIQEKLSLAKRLEREDAERILQTVIQAAMEMENEAEAIMTIEQANSILERAVRREISAERERLKVQEEASRAIQMQLLDASTAADTTHDALQRVNTILEQMTSQAQEIKIDLKAEELMSEINMISDRWAKLRAELEKPISATFDAKVESSPARPFTEGMRHILDMFGQIPRNIGVNFQMANMPFELLSAYEPLRRAEREAMEAERLRSHFVDQFYATLGFMAPHAIARGPSVMIPPDFSRFEEQAMEELVWQRMLFGARLAGMGARGAEPTALPMAMEGPPTINIEVGPITVDIGGAGDGRDLAIELADRLDEEIAAKIRSNRSKIPAALGM